MTECAAEDMAEVGASNNGHLLAVYDSLCTCLYAKRVK